MFDYLLISPGRRVKRYRWKIAHFGRSLQSRAALVAVELHLAQTSCWSGWVQKRPCKCSIIVPKYLFFFFVFSLHPGHVRELGYCRWHQPPPGSHYNVINFGKMSSLSCRSYSLRARLKFGHLVTNVRGFIQLVFNLCANF